MASISIPPSADEKIVSATKFKHRVTFDRLTINFITNSPLFFDWLQSYYQSAAADSNTAEIYTVHFEQIGSTSEHVIESPNSKLFTKFCLIADAHCFYGEGKFFSSAEGEQAHKIELDVQNRMVRANLGGVFLQSEESFIYVVVRDILRRLVLPLGGLLMLHGSVVTKGNQTIFFAGNKAMGKTTVALEMLKNGYKIMSDDSPLAAGTANGAHVLSGRDQFSITENTLSLFPELREFLSRRRDVSGKFFLDRTRMGTDRTESEPKRITHFVDLRRGENNPLELKRCDKALATAAFVREFMPLFRKELTIEKQPQFFRQINSNMFLILSALLSNAITYSLSYSNEHREQIPNLLESLIVQTKANEQATEQ